MRISDWSSDVCSSDLGGTHVRALGDIALFKIVGESAVSSGVRRIEALTGEAARMWLIGSDEALKAAAAARSEEHTSELQSLMRSSYADFCLKKKKSNYTSYTQTQYY